jgi:D-arabinitol 2-dehydrogenase
MTPVPRAIPASVRRQLHVSENLRHADKKPTTFASAADTTEHEGSFARTDASVQVEYPEENELPSSAPLQGRGGLHFKRTLASFSLEGKVGVVTGGARGLGLVMSQALVISGADIAIVDLNST